MNIQLNSYKNSAKLNSFHSTKKQGQAGAFENILQQTLGNRATDSISNRIAGTSRANFHGTSSQWQRA